MAYRQCASTDAFSNVSRADRSCCNAGMEICHPGPSVGSCSCCFAHFPARVDSACLARLEECRAYLASLQRELAPPHFAQTTSVGPVDQHAAYSADHLAASAVSLEDQWVLQWMARTWRMTMGMAWTASCRKND